MTLWPSAYGTHLGVGRPRFHSSLRERLLYFYIKELLGLDTPRLGWRGYWTQIFHIPGKYQWAKQWAVIQTIAAISGSFLKESGGWLFEGADVGSDQWEGAQVLTLPPELCLGDRLEKYQLARSNSCQGMLEVKYCRWWHASAQPRAVVWVSLPGKFYWENGS